MIKYRLYSPSKIEDLKDNLLFFSFFFLRNCNYNCMCCLFCVGSEGLDVFIEPLIKGFNQLVIIDLHNSCHIFYFFHVFVSTTVAWSSFKHEHDLWSLPPSKRNIMTRLSVLNWNKFVPILADVCWVAFRILCLVNLYFKKVPHSKEVTCCGNNKN